MGTEIELKLALTQAALTDVLKNQRVLLGGSVLGPAKKLATRYYDTPKHALRAKDIFLRVRKTGRSFIQTVKTAGAYRLLADRPEWEWPVQNSKPDLRLAAETGLKPLIKRARKGDLLEVFLSEVFRRTALVKADHASVEVALDLGSLRAGSRTMGVCELELELKEGRPEPIFALARDLVQIPGVTLSTATKAERGFALASGRNVSASKATEPDLPTEATPLEAAAEILDGCAVQAADNLFLISNRRTPEAVHQLRVAMRRLRAALTVFKGEIAPDRRRWLKSEAGWLSEAMGPARDLDVMLGQTLKSATGPADLSTDLASLKRHIGRARRDAWQEAVAAASSPRAQILLLDICRTAAELRNRPPDIQAPRLAVFAAACLEARLETVLALGQNIDQLHSDARHSLRLALKKLRYAADFFASLFPRKKVRAELKALGRLQDAFGGFNDATVAEHVLKAATARLREDSRSRLDRAALFVSGWAAHRGELAWADARRRWEDFAATAPFWRDVL